MLGLTTAAALAAPVFTGPEADVALATEAWAAAVACTGWEPLTPPTITIERVPVVREGFAGVALAGRDGVRAIQVRDDAPNVVLVHEVAHAWFHRDGPALNEGRSEVLAECVAEALPEQIRFLRADDYIASHLADLRTWTNPLDTASRVNHAQYTGAWRLFRIIGAVVPDRAVLGPDVHDWEDVLALLDAAGAPGRQVADAIGGGVATQRTALDDADRDGLVTLHEAVLGLDPERWDTDGDGWWDGAPAARPAHAVPLRHDGAGVCLPWAPATGPVPLVLGGVVRGEDAQMSAVSRAQRSDASPTVERHSVLRAPTARSQRGGYWALAGGPTEPNPRCRMTAGATVVDRNPGAPEGLDGFAAALDRGQAAVAQLLEPATRRLLVVLGADTDDIRVPEQSPAEVGVEVSPARWRAAAADPAELETLAFHVAVVARLSESDAPFALNAALATAVREDAQGAKGTIYGVAWRGEVNRWRRDAERCGSWAALLAQDCR